MKGRTSLKQLILLPALLFLASVMAEVANCHRAQTAIQTELSDTITALARCEDNFIAKQDTIQRLERINYAMAQPLVMIADQKMPGTFLALSFISMVGIACYRRRLVAAGLVHVGTAEEERLPYQQQVPPLQAIHLTPMQRQLVEMLSSAPNRCVPKREICAALWGKKDNAEESLYTLVRRTKKSLAEANAEIVCNRGESYQLRFS